MKDHECPKCGDNVRPKWHAKCVPIVEKPYVSYSNNEHLHYFCKCGYDFIRAVTQDEVY